MIGLSSFIGCPIFYCTWGIDFVGLGCPWWVGFDTLDFWGFIVDFVVCFKFVLL